MRRRVAYWVCQVAGWGSYSVVGVAMTAQQVGWRPTMVAGYALFSCYSIALTDWLRREIRRRNWLDAGVAQVAGRLALAALIIGSVQSFLVAAVSFVLGGVPEFLHPVSLAYAWISITAATTGWIVFYVAITAPRRYREKEVRLELALRQAELRALEAQVNPHFLFNCLNSIRALVLENPPLAQDMLTRLARILRFNLHRDLMYTIPLSEEVEAVGDYLALEKVRFEERLRVEVEIAPDAAGARVPPMVLQTLVENALKHGIANLPAGGAVVIRAAVEGDTVKLEVENTGELKNSAGEPKGLGLANARERLRLLYGDRARLDLAAAAPGRVIARAVIPRNP